jgi:L-fucose isomerase-like protein
MIKKKVKLGVAPTRRFVFSKEDAHKYKKLVEDKLRSWDVDFVTIDGINAEGLLINTDDSMKAAALFRSHDVDAVFTPHVNFGTEEAVARLGKTLGKPLLLWGPRDEAPQDNGIRLRDTQCGLFATSNVLMKYGVPFSYIVNSRIDDPVFERGVRTFLSAVRAAKAFIGARIGQVSTRPANFYTVICNEQELMSRWDIELVPVTLTRVEKAVRNLVSSDKRVKEEVASISSRLSINSEVKPEFVQRIAALKIFMEDWARDANLSAIAFKCHEDLQDALGIYPCVANGELTNLGVPVICETDIHGALTSVLLQAAARVETPIFFADLTVRHPTNDNAELLWHCGNFPQSLAKVEYKGFLSGHYVIPPHDSAVGNFPLVGGPVTIARFDGMNGEYSLLLGHGRGIDGPYTRGTYLWVEVPDWPMWEERLIRGPYVHHVAAVHDQSAYALYEATRFIPGLKPDAVQPTESEIRAYLRGR